MYTIAIIADSTIPDKPCRDLIEFIRLKGHIAKYVPVSKLSVVVRDGDVKICIRGKEFSVDGIFLRSLGLLIDVEQFIRRISIIKVMEEKGVITINPLNGFLKSRSKLETIIELSKHGIPVPETYCTEDLLYAYTVAKELGDFVIKPIQGSRGFGAIRLNDADVAFHVMKTLINFKKPIYIQKYINKPNRDIRIIVVNGRAIAGIYRYAPEGEWRTNTARGGIAKPLKITSEIEEISVKACEVIGAYYAGVDLIEDKDGYKILEVNVIPEFKNVMRVTGINIAKEIVNMLIQLMRK